MTQVVLEKRNSLDVIRTVRTGAFGFVVVAPSMHVWYGFLARNIKGSGLVPGLKRMVVDQTVFAPAIIAAFFIGMGALEGKVSSSMIA